MADTHYLGHGSNWTSHQRHTAHVTLYCTWRPSGLATGLHVQGDLEGDLLQNFVCLDALPDANKRNHSVDQMSSWSIDWMLLKDFRLLYISYPVPWLSNTKLYSFRQSYSYIRHTYVHYILFFFFRLMTNFNDVWCWRVTSIWSKQSFWASSYWW